MALANPMGVVKAIVHAAVAAVEPGRLTARALEGRVPGYGPIHLVAFGKASAAMARGAVERLGSRIVSGVVVHPRGAAPGMLPAHLSLCEADHPLPSGANIGAAVRVGAEAAMAGGSGRVLLVLISGGGSAHLTLPAPGIAIDDLRAVTGALMRAGANIVELNTVRKHAEALKGGGLARMALGAEIHAMVLSDVIGDRLDSIASGPVSPDATTFADALAVVDRYGVRGASAAVTAHLERGAAGLVPETPKPGDAALARVEATIVGSNRDAVKAAGLEAGRLGVMVAGMEFDAQEEARAYGERVAGIARDLQRSTGGTPVPPGKPVCWIGGGETTVRVGDATGVGGRCQEAALAAAAGVDGLEGIAIAFGATDGVDGPPTADGVTPAGGVVDGRTAGLIRAAGMDLGSALAEHDSTRALRAAGAILTTGPTGTNVNDLAVALVYPESAAGRGG